MKVLITGVNGFIGSRLAERLLQREHVVYGLGFEKEGRVGRLNRYVTGDVLDMNSVEEALSDADAVVHLAALTAHEEVVDRRYETLKTNLEGVRNVLEAFNRSNKTSKFIFSSTGKVYGKLEQLPISEKHPLKPLNVLGKSKRISEDLIDFYASQDKSYVVFRIFNVFGPGQKSNFLVPTILKQIGGAEGECEITLGDVKAQRDYLYIEDVIEAFVMALEGVKEGGLSIYNICSGEPVSAEDIVEVIAQITGLKIKVYVDKSRIRKDESDVEYGSGKKAFEAFGWKPETGLKEGLEKTLEGVF